MSHTHTQREREREGERERERALEPEYINAGGYLYTHHSCIGLRTLHVHTLGQKKPEANVWFQ